MNHSDADSPRLAQGTPAPAVAPAPPPAPVTAGAGGGMHAAEAPVALPPIPQGGGRLIVDRVGDRTVFTTTAVPPEMMVLAQQAQETALGLMGLLLAIVILGPFARMWARRIENRGEMDAVGAVGANAQLQQQQLHQLQQSVDAMSVEVERIGESQRFQSKLLHDKQRV